MFSPSLEICILKEALPLCETDLVDINRIRKPRRRPLTMDNLARLIKSGLVVVVRDTSKNQDGQRNREDGNFRIVGIISILPRKRGGKKRLSVDPEYTQFGIGHQLLREAEKFLEEAVA